MKEIFQSIIKIAIKNNWKDENNQITSNNRKYTIKNKNKRNKDKIIIKKKNKKISDDTNNNERKSNNNIKFDNKNGIRSYMPVKTYKVNNDTLSDIYFKIKLEDGKTNEIVEKKVKQTKKEPI